MDIRKKEHWKTNSIILNFIDSVDTIWIIGVLEKRLQPLLYLFALSGDHSKQQFRLGCGLIIGWEWYAAMQFSKCEFKRNWGLS